MKALTKELVKKIGYFDKASRFYLKPEYETETSKEIREPSRAFPFSVYKHCFTMKYYNSLSENQKRMLGIVEA
jgi:hypothetical protein